MNKKVIVSLIVLIITSVLIYVLMCPIKLKRSSVEISYGQKYQEPGYTASKYGKNYSKKVKIKESINYKKLGTYKVIYSLKIGFITYKKERQVKIIDDERPKIELTGSSEVNVCPSTEYQEEGYIAKDNYDGDITSKVKITKKEGRVVYTVKDSSKNKTSLERKLIYQDVIAPEIKLNGEEKKSITVGNTYNELGATAMDNCDGDITSNISISSPPDTSKPGTYPITYTVKDNAGNESSIIREITVVNKVSLDGRPGTIYLTFDDGPNSGTTDAILNILKEEGVKATFFVTNNGPDSLIKREYDEGHTVALHTASHNYSILYSSDDAYYQDLFSVQDRVRRITGETSMIVRFPGGSSNTVSRKYSSGIMSRLTQSLVSKGFKYYDWNISSGDAGETTSSSGVYNNVIKSLRKDRVNMILMHDIKTYTRDALRSIIQYGKQSGYSFERITLSTPMVTQGVNN